MDNQEYFDKVIKSKRIACGADVEPGWLDLVVELDKKIRALQPDYEITQIKEKFGGLRFYVGGVTQEVYDLIDAAERESYETCAECGSQDETVNTQPNENQYWIRTLCATCRKN